MNVVSHTVCSLWYVVCTTAHGLAGADELLIGGLALIANRPKDAGLDELMKGKTVIYCAHRLSSIINADKIHVLKDGKV